MGPIDAIKALKAYNALKGALNMPDTGQVLSSRTVLVLLVMLIVNGLNELLPFLPPKWAVVANAALTLLGIVFRIFPRQNFHPPTEGMSDEDIKKKLQ